MDMNGVIVPKGENAMNERCLNELQRIVQETNCRIVLSSSWRMSSFATEKIQIKLKELEMQPLFGKTPWSGKRINEILFWVESWNNYVDEETKSWRPSKYFENFLNFFTTSKETSFPPKQNFREELLFETEIKQEDKVILTSWVALDDEDLVIPKSKNNVIQTQSEIGLTKELADQAIAILNRA